MTLYEIGVRFWAWVGLAGLLVPVTALAVSRTLGLLSARSDERVDPAGYVSHPSYPTPSHPNP